MKITDMMDQSCRDMGMTLSEENPFGCGRYFVGNDTVSSGFFWYLSLEPGFSVTRCDFIFRRDTPMTMSGSFLYLSLRLDYAAHLPPGKIMGFFEEKGGPARVLMPAGRRVAYTEVLYAASFYQSRLTALPSSGHDPVTILKGLGREHNWSPEMVKALADIYRCGMKGRSAELYYIGKAYELMAELIEMGNRRLPEKPGDYDDISRVIGYIDAHYTEKIRQEDLVRLSHMSATRLKTLFRQFTGGSVTDYILGRKTDRAEHLLAETDLPIEEIAVRTGFATPTGFATSFKKQTGMSPSEYRKRIAWNCLHNPSEADRLDI